MKLKWHMSAVHFQAGKLSEMPTEEDPDNAFETTSLNTVENSARSTYDHCKCVRT